MGDVSFESIYNGGISSFDPEYNGFAGKRLSMAGISSTTSPQTANQVAEVVARLKEGVKNVELQPIIADTFETIPKQHFEEIAALMKISGASPSLHAPLLDPAGFEERGGWDEATRDENERRFMNVIEKAHILDPNGNIPIVFHAAGSGTGTEYRPGKGDEKRFHLIKTGIVNQETGQVQAVKEDTMYSLNMSSEELKKGPDTMTVEQKINSANRTDWDQKLVGVSHGINETNEILERAIALQGSEINQSKENPYLEQAQLFIHQNELSANSIFDKAYTYGSKEQREILGKIRDEWQEKMEGIMKDKNVPSFQKIAEKNNLLNSLITNIGEVTQGLDPSRIEEYQKNKVIPEKDNATWGAPKIFVGAEEFASKKSAETFGNLAYKSYEKFGSNAPVIAIENLFPGLGYSTADDVKRLVDEARNKFVEKATKDGMSKGEAKKQAEKLIGVTWDVGHMNMQKKYGFTDEDIIKETEKITPYVKHIHLTDNFGYADTHLAPGMGNVPMKEILARLEKNGDYDNMKKVIEAGGLVNPQMGLRMSPLKATMNAFGSPIYDLKAGPYWNQVSGMAAGAGGYFGGPLAYMPEKHFSMYGSGFSSLPTELGGQMPGNASRVSGAPMS